MISNAYLAMIFDLMSIVSLINTAPHYHLNEHDKGDQIEGIFGGFYQQYGLNACKKLWNRLNHNLKGESH